MDLSLKTVVKNVPGTLIAFQPEEPHGTTETRGVINHILSLNSTSRVSEAYEELARSGASIAFSAAMDGHENDHD